MELNRYFKTRAARFAASLRTTLAMVMALTPTLAMANPEGGVVVGGNATIVSTPSELQIHQSTNSALIEWNGFNINNGETTHFYQPGASSIAVNRVVNSQQISQINGNLVANGKVVVINPNGVIIGPNGNVDTASFLATSADVDNNAVMQGGTLNFNRAGKADAVVENQGKITVKQEGLAALVAPTVRNSGVIQGNLAKVQTAAADTFAVDFYGDGLVQFAVEPAAGDTKRTLKNENTGSIIADGGQVLMTAAAASNIVDSVINNEGVIQAASLENHNGKIVLTGEGATVNVAGKLDTSGQGNADGGQILVGGDFQGQGTLAHAKTVNIADTAELKADAGTTGNGGKIVAWSTNQTKANGKFYARGGSQSGNGGVIETSSKEDLNVDSITANTLATNGKVGNWLLDPANINVVASGGSSYNPATDGNPLTGGTSSINVASINSALSNVILAASGGITFSTNVNIAAAGVGLSAYAGTVASSGGIAYADPNNGGLTIRRQSGTGTINIAGNYIRTNGGAIFMLSGDTFSANNSTFYTRGGDVIIASGDISINNSSAISTRGGDVVLYARDLTNTSGDINTNSTKIDTTNPSSPGIGGIHLVENGSNLSTGSYGNPQNVFVQNQKGGSIKIDGKTIGGNSVCFAAGGAGCVVADPIPATAITVLADALSKIYGNADPLLTYTYTGTLASGDSFTGGLTRAAGENVGTYAINQGTLAITGSSGLTYTITYVSNLLSILKAQLIVNALNQSKTYGNTYVFDTTTPSGDFTVSGLKFSDTVTSVGLASAGAAATANVGSYAINASSAAGTGLSNYTITYNAGSMLVNPAALTITASNGTKTYGSTKTFDTTTPGDFTVAGLKNSDAVNSVALASTGAAATANVGDYAINASNAAGTGLGNYTISYVAGNLHINPALLTITADNQTKTYGSTLSFDTTNPGDFNVSGLKNSDAVNTVNLASSGAAATANVGNYDIIASGATGTGLSNYTINYVEGCLKVNPALLTVTANDRTKTYGDAVTFDTTNPGDFTVSGLKNSDAVNTVSLASTGAAATAGVGNYNINISNANGSGLGNYTITYVKGNLHINPALLTIAAADKTKTYGDTVTFDTTTPSGDFTVAGLKNSDAVNTVTLASAGAPATANVGDYAINVGNAAGTGLGNYTISYVNGNLHINPALLTIAANNQTKTYGNTFTFDTTTPGDFTVSGLKNSDAVNSIALASAGAAGTANVGTYAITGSNAAGTGLGNYTISYVDGLMTVGQARLIITANDQNKTYGNTFTFNGTEFTTAGLVNGDAVNTVDLASAGAPGTANVGNYAITGSNATGTGLGNYSVSYVDGNLHVDPALLTITANNGNKTYGDTFTFNGTEFTTTGLVTANGDSVNTVDLASAGAPATANVGDYAITGSNAAGSGLGNYTITYTDGNLHVDPALLTITANNGNKTYGSTFTFNGTEFTAAGLKNADAVNTVDLASAGAPATANVGDYAITGSNAAGSGLGNYTITYTDGNLHVDPALLTITANNGNKTYGSTFTFNGTEFTAAGLKNTDAVDTVALASAGAPGTASVGDYAITASDAAGSGLSNYTITYADGNLHVDPAQLFLLANNQSKVYGNAFTFNGNEFLLGGTLYNGDTVTGASLASAGSPATANVGNYNISINNATGTGLNNYAISYIDGTMFVNPANLLIIANNDTKTFNGIPYSGGNGVTYVGFKNGDTAESLGFDIGYGGNSQGAVNPGKYDIVPFANFGEQPEIESFAKAASIGNPNYNITFANGLLTINAQTIGPRITFDPLGRPIISVANQAIVLDAPFESIDVANTNTNVSIAADAPAINLASIEPAAGPASDSDLANIEPAAGPGGGETSQEVACGNNFLGNHPCDSNANY